MLILNVPTIKGELKDFDVLFNLWHQIINQINNSPNVTFTFIKCYLLWPNAIVFLGGLARLIQKYNGHCSFDWSTVKDTVLKNLIKNNFYSSFDDDKQASFGNTIPYREHNSEDKVSIIDYLKNQWLGRGWMNISAALQEAIIGNVWEIYANAFEHGKSPIGVISCGQHFPKKHILKLTVVDFGLGIPVNVNSYRNIFKEPQISADESLKWAFQRTNSTRISDNPGGLGLDLLKQFIILNKGQLEVFSNQGYALIDDKKEEYLNRSSFFEGTLVNITFNCNDSFYCLSSEVDNDEPQFYF